MRSWIPGFKSFEKSWSFKSLIIHKIVPRVIVLSNNTLTYQESPYAYLKVRRFFVFFSVKPAVIEVPRVKILNKLYDTPDRQFPVGTAITLTCQGQVGSDEATYVSLAHEHRRSMLYINNSTFRIFYYFRPSDGAQKGSVNSFSPDCHKPQFTQRLLHLNVSTHGPVPSLTIWPIKTGSQGYCVSLVKLKLAGRGQPFNMSTSALLVNYHSI